MLQPCFGVNHTTGFQVLALRNIDVRSSIMSTNHADTREVLRSMKNICPTQLKPSSTFDLTPPSIPPAFRTLYPRSSVLQA